MRKLIESTLVSLDGVIEPKSSSRKTFAEQIDGLTERYRRSGPGRDLQEATGAGWTDAEAASPGSRRTGTSADP